MAIFCESLQLENFDRFTENARIVANNRDCFSDQQKLSFINSSVINMSKKKIDKKSEKWFCEDSDIGRNRREYIIIQNENEHSFKEYMFCIYCVCFGNGKSKSELSQNGLPMDCKRRKPKMDMHESTLTHKESMEKAVHLSEYQDPIMQLSPSAEGDYISRNRYVVNAVICAIMYMVTHGKMTQLLKLLVSYFISFRVRLTVFFKLFNYLLSII